MKQHLNIQRFWGRTENAANIRDLLDPPNDNIVNELNGSSEPVLFNFQLFYRV
jgi:hypothetical protein